jgi:uncharacterized protein YndB with AHSA1/START domain
MPDFPYDLNRTITIQAKPETVFRYFTDSARWANWWGAGSTIEAAPGGKVYIRYPNGVEVSGEVIALRAPAEISFTYGYASGQPIAAGASRVTIRLEADAAGTRLHLRHEFAEAAARDLHVQGWRFQLSLFANVVTNEANANAFQAVDAWFAVWQMADEAERSAALDRIATPQISFRDRFSLLEGKEDLMAHIGAALRFMPGISLARTGDVRHCQGMLLADWAATDKEGKPRMSGTSAITLTADGKIQAVTSFSNA